MLALLGRQNFAIAQIHQSIRFARTIAHLPTDDQGPLAVADGFGINGIEFRSVTIVAYKGKQGPCLERNQAVYRGPFKKVEDDDGHI